MKAVIVDDDEDMRQLVRLVIELDDIEVVGEAADACAGLRCWTATRPDVLIVDYRMPGHNGLDLAERVLGEDPDVQIMVFSSFMTDDAMRRAEDIGVTAVIPKDQLRRLPELIRAAA